MGEVMEARSKIKMISADSHITEPPHCYINYIDPKFRDRAPRVVRENDGGDSFMIEGMQGTVPTSIISAAGIDPHEIKLGGRKFEDLHRGGWEPKARLADQDRDGVIGEIIYPSVGMMLCSLDDADYKHASMWAYNRWLHDEFISGAPDRLFGLGQTAIRSVEEAVGEFERFKEMGFKGVMMPGSPATPFDYDDPRFDPLWKASIELELPLSFHIATSKQEGNSIGNAGKNMHEDRRKYSGKTGDVLTRVIQDVIAMFIYGKVFERHPDLKLVCVEADAGWAAHYIYRLDRTYKRHRYWLKQTELEKLPGDYFRENIYLTFQDDLVAFQTANLINARRLLWANDFPHSDSTWPLSQDVVAEHSVGLTEEMKSWILRDNVAELYKLPRLQ